MGGVETMSTKSLKGGDDGRQPAGPQGLVLDSRVDELPSPCQDLEGPAVERMFTEQRKMSDGELIPFSSPHEASKRGITLRHNGTRAV